MEKLKEVKEGGRIFLFLGNGGAKELISEIHFIVVGFCYINLTKLTNIYTL